jgi:heme/copper-type cytochrome/quinol oxidase subunit 1
VATLERTFPFPRARYTGILEWITTTDHKKIGILYLTTTFFFFLTGGLLALSLRSSFPYGRASRTSSFRCISALATWRSRA